LKENEVIWGDALDILGTIAENTADMIYLDPPFCEWYHQKIVKNISLMIPGKTWTTIFII